MSHKHGGRLPLLSTRPTVTLATLNRAVTSFAARWTEAGWVWTVCLRLLPDSVTAVIWTQALLRLSPACYQSATESVNWGILMHKILVNIKLLISTSAELAQCGVAVVAGGRRQSSLARVDDRCHSNTAAAAAACCYGAVAGRRHLGYRWRLGLTTSSLVRRTWAVSGCGRWTLLHPANTWASLITVDSLVRVWCSEKLAYQMFQDWDKFDTNT